MAKRVWHYTPAPQKDQIRNLALQGMTNREIANLLHKNMNTVASARNRALPEVSQNTDFQLKCRALIERGLTAPEISKIVGCSVHTVYKEMSRTVTRIKSKNEDDIEGINASRRFVSQRIPLPCRILVISDAHHPSAYVPVLEAALKTPGKINAIVVSGDDLDQFSLSKFRHDRPQDMLDEMISAMRWEAKLQDQFHCQLIKFFGNHDERLRKSLLESLKNDIKGMGRTASILMKKLGEIEEWMYRHREDSYLHRHWWIQIGKVIIAHPDRYTAARMSTVQNVSNYFDEKGIYHKGLFIGHLHRMVPPTVVRGKWMCEMPAASQRPSYSESSRAAGGSHHVGYTVITVNKKGELVPNYPNTYCHFVDAL